MEFFETLDNFIFDLQLFAEGDSDNEENENKDNKDKDKEDKKDNAFERGQQDGMKKIFKKLGINNEKDLEILLKDQKEKSEKEFNALSELEKAKKLLSDKENELSEYKNKDNSTNTIILEKENKIKELTLQIEIMTKFKSHGAIPPKDGTKDALWQIIKDDNKISFDDKGNLKIKGFENIDKYIEKTKEDYPYLFNDKVLKNSTNSNYSINLNSDNFKLSDSELLDKALHKK